MLPTQESSQRRGRASLKVDKLGLPVTPRTSDTPSKVTRGQLENQSRVATPIVSERELGHVASPASVSALRSRSKGGLERDSGTTAEVRMVKENRQSAESGSFNVTAKVEPISKHTLDLQQAIHSTAKPVLDSQPVKLKKQKKSVRFSEPALAEKEQSLPDIEQSLPNLSKNLAVQLQQCSAMVTDRLPILAPDIGTSSSASGWCFTSPSRALPSQSVSRGIAHDQVSDQQEARPLRHQPGKSVRFADIQEENFVKDLTDKGKTSHSPGMNNGCDFNKPDSSVPTAEMRGVCIPAERPDKASFLDAPVQALKEYSDGAQFEILVETSNAAPIHQAQAAPLAHSCGQKLVQSVLGKRKSGQPLSDQKRELFSII